MLNAYFLVVVVVEKLLYTSSTSRLPSTMRFVIWVRFGLQAGCASSHKQRSRHIAKLLIAKVLSAKTHNKNRREDKMSSSLKTTIEKIKTLEAEKKNLLIEIEGLKKMADAKAAALENEIGALRNDVKSLKILMNVPEPPSAPNKIQI
jgi:hypothetical protein